MGPLFSIALLGFAGLLVFGIAFGVARIFNAPCVSLAVALAFVLGGGFGSALFGLVWFAVGPQTLTSPWQVVSYLAMLAASGISGGFCLALLLRRALQRSNNSFKADARKARAA
jgi:hypothetical protein